MRNYGPWLCMPLMPLIDDGHSTSLYASISLCVYCWLQFLMCFSGASGFCFQTFLGLGRCVAEAGMGWVTLELASVPMYTGCF